MKKIFAVTLTILFLLTGSVFAVGDNDKGIELLSEVEEFNIDISKINTLKEEFLNNVLTEGESIGINELLDDIKDNEKFIEYIDSKMENVYDALTDFVLNNPEILKEFEDENGVVGREQIKNFFKLFLTPEDIMECLILSIVDADIKEITVDGDIKVLMDKVYAEVDRILNKKNMEDLLNLLYKEVVDNINDNKVEYLQDIIYKEVKDIVDDNNLESLFDEVYNKVIEIINIDDIF